MALTAAQREFLKRFLLTLDPDALVDFVLQTKLAQKAQVNAYLDAQKLAQSSRDTTAEKAAADAFISSYVATVNDLQVQL